MRRILSAIIGILIFFSLQYGKVAGYLYCEAQAKVVLQQAADCGCEQYLVAMFGDDGSDGFAASPIKEKPVELFANDVSIFQTTLQHISITKYFDKQSSLLKRTPNPAFRPPAA